MISDALKRELRRLFQEAFEQTLNNEDSATALQIKEQDSLVDNIGSEFFLLTISSQLFRIFVVLHFNRNDDTRSFVSNALKLSSTAQVDDHMDDYLGELGNSLCGSIKRELNTNIPSLGMSTPNLLNSDCLNYIKAIDIGADYHATASIGDQTLFAASIFISADQALDFKITTKSLQEQEPDSGELEFF